MGEHKHNPTATAAKNGELPPKKKPMGTAESRELEYTWIRERTLLPIMEQEGNNEPLYSKLQLWKR